jgi:hypothetical protein
MTNHTSNYINNFECEKCDFKCSKKGDWNRHIMTPKHKLMTNNDKNTSNNIIIFECECGKSYKHRQNLHTHKKKCGIVQSPETTKPEIVQDIDKELLIKMLLKNQDILEGVILKNSDVMEKMVEIMPQIGNTTNSHNTQNNQFNIHMFLNEHCKNAMNLTDFVQSLPITSETYDSTIENGLTKTIANLMVNGLNELDILERPIHCTDASRKTLYVKESDVWEKDTELLHVINSIKYLSIKHRGAIKIWKDANEGWQTKDKLQSKMSTLIIHSMKLIERDERETSKIIRSISKSVYLDNETKKCYM